MNPRRASTRLGAWLATIVASLALSGTAWAITPTITEFTSGLHAGSDPYGITAGPDGNLWFTDRGSSPGVGRVTPDGAITEFTSGLLAGNSRPWEITAGPDGNLWFTDFAISGTARAIGRITPGGTITEFSAGLPINTVPLGITAGPDGALWFADNGVNKIGRIDPTTHAITEYALPANTGPVWITQGPDGNLWFSAQGTHAIGRFNPFTHSVAEFSTGLAADADPEGIAAGPDGNLWFADDASSEAIGRMTTAGAGSEFSIGQPTNAHSPLGVASGSDGQVWFTDNTVTGEIGRISPSTQTIDEFSTGLNAGSQPELIAAGPDGNLWFADGGATKAIGRITTPPAATTTSATATGPTTAKVPGSANGHAQSTSFHIEFGPVGGATTNTPEQSLGTTSADTPVSASIMGLTPNTTYQARIVVTNPTGTTAGAFVTFTTPPLGPLALSKVGQSHRRWREGSGLPHVARVKRPPVGTTFRFTLNTSARVRFVFMERGRKRGTLSFNVGAGAHKLRFQGRISKHKRLKPGRYVLTIIASNSAGQHAKAKLKFTIVAP